MTAPREKPTIPQVAPLIRDYYAEPDHGMGGSLHIVLEDRNIRDRHICSCLDFAIEQGDESGVLLAELLFQMSLRQRRLLHSAYSFCPGFIRGKWVEA